MQKYQLNIDPRIIIEVAKVKKETTIKTPFGEQVVAKNGLVATDKSTDESFAISQADIDSNYTEYSEK